MLTRFSLSAGLVILGLMTSGMTAMGATTDGTITFQDDTSATAPVDPTSPNVPLTPADPNNPATNNTGTLTLDVAPKSIDFGTATTSNAAKTYTATGTYNQYLQVSDKRTTANGWQVNVKQDRTLTNDSNNHVLTGAVIHLPQGTARNSLNEPASVADSNLVVAPSVSVTTADQVVFSAPNQAGVGKATSTNTWNAGAVTLSIPKLTAQVGNYTNNLVWTLVAATTN
ncbi:WxL domain-containing protein [Lactiplantibacillus paraplantarum]|uniref:WxL domain-containing protein n=1 Tax=Lactiplantibacillus paraplantarum TaxID=60520 RepID=UPI003DA1E03E